ncbi:MAG: hypothetical protein JJ913_07345 [Rhizobiaceae bacterium]|nr:hypothetical protein [Rhizobiaceae bacterium]
MMRFAGIMLVAIAVSACTRTTAIQQVLDPRATPQTVPADDSDEQADVRTADGMTVQKSGDRIFLVPGPGTSPEAPPPAN